MYLISLSLSHARLRPSEAPNLSNQSAYVLKQKNLVLDQKLKLPQRTSMMADKAIYNFVVLIHTKSRED